MEGRGECCIARYAAGGPCDMNKVDRIMLKYRPIAPKLAATTGSTPENINTLVGGRRGKRRYVRCNNNTNKRRSSSGRRNKASLDVVEEAVVTLPLLPEKPDQKASEKRGTVNDDVFAPVWSGFGSLLQETAVMKDAVKKSESCVTVDSATVTVDETLLEKRENVKQAKYAPIWLSFGSLDQESAEKKSESCATVESATATVEEKVLERENANDAVLVDLWGKQAKHAPIWLNFGSVDQESPAMRISETIVTVESVTETWINGDGIGRTDEERKVNLDNDTCPSFISDGLRCVTWTNAAYREMVGGEEVVVVVRLVMKESVAVRVMLANEDVFSCRVRLKYTCRKEMSSVVLPCDVWRMRNGGFAWRLDVKAALCLGR